MPDIASFQPLPQLPTGLGACMTTRDGGCSLPPWQSLNLGDHVGDVPGHVQANRRLLAHSLQARPVFLQQVHGTGVVELHADTPDGTPADACYTFDPGVVCTIMVADCLPLLLWDTAGRWVAAAHAGCPGWGGWGGRACWKHCGRP